MTGAFGEGLGSDLISTQASAPVRYAYTGREYDAETDIYYYRNRSYDQNSGRFLTEDPIGVLGGDNNFYRYGVNSVTIKVDPLGLFVGPGISTEAFQEFAKTAKGKRAIERNFGETEASQNFRYVQVDDRVIDMRHASAAYNTTKDLIDSGVPGGLASQITFTLGLGIEVDQLTGGRITNVLSDFDINATQDSLNKGIGFSEEDVPSNLFGIKDATSGQTLGGFCGGN